MLSSIHPFGERARDQRYGVTSTAFLVGSVVGGAVLGGALGALSLLSQAAGPFPGVAMLILVVSAAWEISDAGVPSLKRQVNEEWLPRYRGWVYGVGFGLQLGVGFATYIKTPLTYGFALAAVAAGSPQAAFLGGLAFGLVRGLSIFLTRSVETPDRLRRLFTRLGERRNAVRLGSATVVVLLAAVGLIGLS